jgi:hypothetical protein
MSLRASTCMVQRNFEHRKVSLGTCGRSYATACTHEHSCLRCPLLRPDSAQRQRLIDVRDNLLARIKEARTQRWLGEVEGLQISLAGARTKLAQLDHAPPNPEQTRGSRHPPPPTRMKINKSSENKHTFGYHPMLAFCDNTGKFLATELRRGNAGSNTAADHITVCDAALAQIPDAHRHGTPILIRADTAGATKEFLAHIRALRDHAVSSSFSVGWAITERERATISALPTTVWADAIDADGAHRDGAALAEITGMLPARVLAGYPTGTRVIVRRERPHPGAQLDAFEERDGYRYTAFATDTAFGQLAHLDGRHRAHARVEDRIRTAKDTGLNHFPSVISSSIIDHVAELGRYVVDGVGGGEHWWLFSARSNEFHRFAVRRVAAASFAEDVGDAVFAKCAGEGVPELLVVVFESADAVGGGVQALQQRGLGGALTLGWGSGRRRGSVESLDIGAQVGLGVEPGSGDAGFAGEAVEGDGCAGGVHAPQRGDSATAGLLGAALGGCAQVAGVVSRHRGRPSRRARSR